MIFADALYTFNRALNPKTGEPSTRHNMTGLQGLDILNTRELKRGQETGTRYIYYNQGKGKRSPDAPEMAFYFADGENTGCFEPDLAMPGEPVRGYGDVNPESELMAKGQDAILYERYLNGCIKIAIYQDYGEQADKLYQQWQAGLVFFGLSDNKPYLVSKSDAEP
jgi:hypothetical protein